MENKSWNELPLKLAVPIKKALNEMGFNTMTPVQAACIPLMLNYKDIAVEAVTGSGKTLAFVIPIVQTLLNSPKKPKKFDIISLIIIPTRELANQIYEVLQKFLVFCPDISSLLFVGGKSVASDLLTFTNNGGHIVISTPGRLGDLLARKIDDGPSLSGALKSLEILILDEADRLLDCGFSATLNTIFAYLPKQRRTGIFSATQTNDVTNLIRAGMRNPVQVKVKEKGSSKLKTPSSLKNFYLICEAKEKVSILLSLLRKRISEKTLVFFSTCACVEYFYEILKQLLPEVNLLSLHGKMKQKRYRIFDQFRQLSSGVLLCTDVLCRGVDIPSVEWVIQFDPPTSAASFVHRCGRTARNGEIGSAVLMLLPNEADYVGFIELNQKVELDEMELPSDLTDCLDKTRALQLKDRAIMDKANRAFVSHIQAYTKHECNIIINIKHLNLGSLATGFGLLKLPRMPELKNYDSPDFIPVDIDFNEISYVDSSKEKERQNNLAVYRKTGKWPGLKPQKCKQSTSWSQKKEIHEAKKQKRQKKMDKVETNKFSEKDLKDLDDDFRMLKKFKKGKISDADFALYFGCENE